MTQTGATVSINGAEPVPALFSMEVERIDISTLGHSEPDPTWEFTDAAGHFHAFDHEGELPTLVSRMHVEPQEDEPDEIAESTTADEADDWDEFGDSYPETRSHCLLCDEVIQPRWNYIATPYHQYAPGRTEYRLTLHSPIPAGRFSVVVTAGDKVWFGVAEGRWVSTEQPAFGERVDTYEAWCGPMSWRKRQEVPAS